MNIKEIRRNNLRALAKELGGLCKLAGRLGRSPSYLSHLIKQNPIKNIGDKFSADIEKIFDKPAGWMDRLHDESEDILAYTIETAVPLIDWQNVATFSPSNHQPIYSLVLARKQPIACFSQYAFALKLYDDSMESSEGLTFPMGGVVLVEPEHVVRAQTFVIANLPETQQVVMRQLVYEGNKRYLKALNPKYPVLEIEQPQSIIYGVVKLLLQDIKSNK